MNSGLISQRYAKSLLEYSEEHKLSDVVYSEAKVIANSFKQVSKLRTMLANPFISKNEKQKVMLLALGKNASKAIELFVGLVVKNGREDFFERMMLRYIDLYREKNDIHFAVLTTAIELDEKTEKRLLETMEKTIGGRLETEKTVNPDVLGGFVFEVDSVRWDASLARQLADIRNEYLAKK